MKYKCLRDCYVNDRFWREGEVYELSDDMKKSEKNFRPVDEPAPESPSPEPKPEPVKPDVLPPGQFWCTKCKALHRETSKIGKRHLKLNQEA